MRLPGGVIRLRHRWNGRCGVYVFLRSYIGCHKCDGRIHPVRVQSILILPLSSFAQFRLNLTSSSGSSTYTETAQFDVCPRNLALRTTRCDIHDDISNAYTTTCRVHAYHSRSLDIPSEHDYTASRNNYRREERVSKRDRIESRHTRTEGSILRGKSHRSDGNRGQ